MRWRRVARQAQRRNKELLVQIRHVRAGLHNAASAQRLAIREMNEALER